jgi:hypothetical protein
MVPVNELSENCNHCKEINAPSDSGMVPLNLLPCTSNRARVVKATQVEGMVPVKLLLAKPSEVRSVKRLKSRAASVAVVRVLVAVVRVGVRFPSSSAVLHDFPFASAFFLPERFASRSRAPPGPRKRPMAAVATMAIMARVPLLLVLLLQLWR